MCIDIKQLLEGAQVCGNCDALILCEAELYDPGCDLFNPIEGGGEIE